MKKGSFAGTLHLAVKRGDEIIVEYSKNEIMNKINSYFGYKLIGEIKLESFNSNIRKKVNRNTTFKSLKNFDKKIDKIKNENIRNSLIKLLKTINNE